MKIVPERIKKARIMSSMSLADLGKLIGVSKQSAHMYEHGKRTINSEMLIKISNATKMPVDYFYRPIVMDIDFGKIHFNYNKY